MSRKYRFPDLARCATVEWDENEQPYSPAFGDVYFSREHGLNESRHVFIEGNRLTERWQTPFEHSQFTIFETGFGTGLNFLATWQAWEQSAACKNKHLHFISVEAHPLCLADLKRAMTLWPELDAYAKILLQHYPPQPGYSFQRVHLVGPKQSELTLTLIFDDVASALEDFRPDLGASPSVQIGEHSQKIDAWFLDGFAPSKNGDMWMQSLFNAMARHSDTGSSFATFTCAGVVKRGLREAGFECKKIAGYGRKREMLVGELSNIAREATAFSEQAFYFSQSKPTLSEKPAQASIAIIGAGLAGAQLAYRMAQRGWHVQVFDESTIASGASGNLQGVVYTRPSLQANPLNEFNLLAQQYADSFYRSQGFYENCGKQCGVLHLAFNETQHKRLHDFYQAYYSTDENIQWLNKDQASELIGRECLFEGLLLKRSGYLYPAKLVARLLQHPNIQTHEQCKINTLDYQNGQWHLSGEDKYIASASVCVIANANSANIFSQSAHLPSKAVRGQVSYGLSNTLGLDKNRLVICAEGYLAPATEFNGSKVNTFGASFNLISQSLDISEAEHSQNLEHLHGMLNMSGELEAAIVGGRVGLRCTTPDYFPIVGPVAQADAMRDLLAPLATNAKIKINKPGDYHPGLYCSFGYGSRGLAYSALCSEVLADLICGAPLPMRWPLYRYLHPTRFILREIQREIGSRGR